MRILHKSSKLDSRRLTSYSEYEQELFDYNLLPQIDYVNGDGNLITNGQGLKLLYAMELGKPILLQSPPTFASDCLLFVREEIMKRLSKIYIANTHILDPEDSVNLLKSIQTTPTNYTLTRHQKIILRSYIRLHLRQLAA